MSDPNSTTSSLVLAVDSTSALKAAADLNSMAAASNTTEAAVKRLGPTLTNAVGGAAASSINATTAAFAKNALAAGATATAADKVSHASSGMTRELIVLAHELSQGNTTRFGGSLLVLAEYSKGATAALSALVGPVGLVIGSVAALGVAIAKGASQSSELAKSLEITGNYAGLTEGRFNELAASISKSTASTILSARSQLQDLVSTGRYTGDTLASAAKAAELFSHATGLSAGDTTQLFAALSDGVAKGAEELNKTYHFLTAAQLEQIKTLEDQGQSQKALTLTFDALSDRMKGTTQNLGLLQSAWHGVKDAAAGAIEAMLSIGRKETTEGAIASLQSQLAQTSDGPLASLYGARNEKLKDGIAFLQEQLRLQNRAADSTAKEVQKQSALIAFDKLKEDSLTKQERLTRDLANANGKADAAGLAANDPARLKVLADIREKYAEKGRQPIALDKSTLEADLQAIKDSMTKQIDVYKNADTIFEAQRAAGLVSDKQYFEQKRVDIELNEAVEIKAINAEIARRKATTFTGSTAAKDAIDNQKEVDKLEAQRSETLAKNATLAQTNAVREKAASDQRLIGYQSATVAAQRYIDALKAQNDLQLSTYTLGARAAQEAVSQASIKSKYDTQIQGIKDLQAIEIAHGNYNADQRAKDEQDIATAQKLRDGELESTAEYYRKLKALQSDGSNGATKALNDFSEAAQDVAGQTYKAYTDVLNTTEDAAVQLFTKGKVDIHSLADSIIADFVRIEVKALELQAITALQNSAANDGAGLLSKLLGTYTGTTGVGSATGGAQGGVGELAGVVGQAAGGGTTPARGLLQVNEKGPELLNVGGKQYLMPLGESGRITPNDKLGGGPMKLSIINQTSAPIGQVTQMQVSPTERALIIQEAIKQSGNQFADPNSHMSKSFSRGYKAERKRSA